MHPGRIVAFLRTADHLPPAAVTDRQAVEAFLRERLAPFIDFGEMARHAAGPFYPDLGRPERDSLAGALRSMFIRALAGQLVPRVANVPRVDLHPTRYLRWGDEASVLALVTSPPSPPVWMVFRFHRTPEGWKVFDVAANGFSAVSHYRTHFAGLVRRHGPKALHR